MKNTEGNEAGLDPRVTVIFCKFSPTRLEAIVETERNSFFVFTSWPVRWRASRGPRRDRGPGWRTWPGCTSVGRATGSGPACPSTRRRSWRWAGPACWRTPAAPRRAARPPSTKEPRRSKKNCQHESPLDNHTKYVVVDPITTRGPENSNNEKYTTIRI